MNNSRLEPLGSISNNIVASRTSRAAVHAVKSIRTMDIRVQDEYTADSAATASLASGLTSLEDETTDEFGKLLLQNAREQQIIHDARLGKVQPFRRARPRQRGRLTLENLERNHSDKENAGVGEVLSSPPASISSGERSDPPLNIPRDWGRKARKNHDWLRRVKLGDDRQEVRSDDEVVLQRKTSYTGDGTPHTIDWTKAAANIPIPTTDGSPSPFRYARGTPPSIQKQNDSSSRLQEWNVDDDFTTNSLIASTPAPKSRNTALDEIRIRELETVEEMSVIEEMSPAHRSPSLSAQRRRLSSSEAAISSSTPRQSQEIQSPKRGTAEHLLSNTPASAKAQKADLSSSSPVVVYTSEDYAKSSTPQRPQPHRRSDSRDLLRQLARAASGTPSPGRASQEPQKELKPEPVEAKKDLPIESSPDRPLPHRKSRSPQRANDEISNGRSPARRAGSAASMALEDFIPPIEDPVDPHTPLPGELEADRAKESTPAAKTPIVTGAWIDTPAPATAKRTSISPRKSQRASSASDPSSKSPSKPQSNIQPPPIPDLSASPPKRHSPRKPSLPTSALAAIVEGARPTTHDGRTVSHDFPIGDSTINSLEDIIDSSLLEPASAPSAQAVAATEDEENNTETMTLPFTLPAAGAKPRNAAERQRWKEMEQVARMNAQLRAARSNIRDARVGLRRFENAVLSSPETSRERGSGRVDSCNVCGCPGGPSPFAPVISSCKALFVKPLQDREVEPSSKAAFLHRGRQRLTLFSIALLMLLCYMLAEAAMCSQFCHPRYAHSMRGYGVDPNAPRLPFVMVTLLFRPFRWAWKPMLNSLAANSAEVLRDAGILPEQQVAKLHGVRHNKARQMTGAAWENKAEPPPSIAAANAAVKRSSSSEAQSGTMAWVQNLRAQASQVWDDVEWSKMDDDEVL